MLVRGTHTCACRNAPTKQQNQHTVTASTNKPHKKTASGTGQQGQTRSTTQPSRHTCIVATIVKATANNHQDPSTMTDRWRLCRCVYASICCGIDGLCAVVTAEPNNRQFRCLPAARIHMLSPMLYPMCPHTTHTNTNMFRPPATRSRCSELSGQACDTTRPAALHRCQV